MSEARALTTGAPDVTITVQITVSGEVLPLAAHRLVSDLQELAAAGHGAARSAIGVHPAEVGVAASPPAREHAALRLVGSPCGERATLRVQTRSRTVLRDGMPVHLARREYDLLAFLCQHPRRVFSRGQLLRQVWDYEMVGGERTVDVHVRRLRAKLGPCAEGLVTVRGVGYRLDDDAEIAVVVVSE
ncbi:MAG TPA: winged helix-turn-helix domain-containing protein [Micromonosporaceae bacterium]|nr:winged helix-turn-helix domain-containing protein [Micromonosporaceae bacterium]